MQNVNEGDVVPGSGGGGFTTGIFSPDLPLGRRVPGPRSLRVRSSRGTLLTPVSHQKRTTPDTEAMRTRYIVLLVPGLSGVLYVHGIIGRTDSYVQAIKTSIPEPVRVFLKETVSFIGIRNCSSGRCPRLGRRSKAGSGSSRIPPPRPTVGSISIIRTGNWCTGMPNWRRTTCGSAGWRAACPQFKGYQ